MEFEGLSQKAGDGAVQTQVKNLTIINNGITEERVREICQAQIPQILKEYTAEATQTATRRIEQFENKLIRRVNHVEEMLPAFSDPAFQILLKKAQIQAVATEREKDYDLLTELLVCHVQKGNDRRNRAGINKAIEVIDNIDNEALCGLTLAFCIVTFVPNENDIDNGLSRLNNLYEKLQYVSLPHGNQWLDHLDILGTIRLSDLSKLKKTSEYLPGPLGGYCCAGIEKDSSQYTHALELLREVGLDQHILCPNKLLSGYFIIPVVNEMQINELQIYSNGNVRAINEKEVEALRKIWNLYDNDQGKKTTVIKSFMEKWDSFESLKKFREWYDSIVKGFEITRVGAILAHINAKRCDPHIPDLV